MTQIQFNGKSMPEAYVVRTQTQSRGRYKITDGNIYIQDGQEFEIELYNPTENLILAKLSLNGRDEDSPGLVLKPGQRIYLDRYLTEAVKFKFDTYEVDKTTEGHAAIVKNGLLKIKFYEQAPVKITNGYHIKEVPVYIPYKEVPYYVPYQPFNTRPWCDRVWYNTGGYYSNNINSTVTIGGSTLGNGGATFTTANSANMSYNVNDAKINDSYLTDEFICNSSQEFETESKAPEQMETGRIEKGSTSDQNFVNVNYDFNAFACHEITYTLLPLSRKPIESKDLVKYCTSCGTKAKKNHLFCAKCGNKLDE